MIIRIGMESFQLIDTIGDQIIQHTVVFEPDAMRMHVAFAESGTHATDCQRITIDVGELLN